MSRKRKNLPQKRRDGNSRERAVAHFLLAGDPPSTACRKAGYAESSVRVRAAKMCRREAVKKALLDLELSIKPQEIGRLSKARLHQELTSLPSGAKHGKLLLGYVRTGLEMEHIIGGATQGDLHLHQTFSPTVVNMLSERMAHILVERHGMTPEQAVKIAQQESGVPIDVEAIRPKPQLPVETTPPPEPIKQDDPVPLTFEERQNR
jgi:hypothetical protein